MSKIIPNNINNQQTIKSAPDIDIDFDAECIDLGLDNNKISENEKLFQDINPNIETYDDCIKFNTNPDGTTTAQFYIKPVFYKDDKGIQQYIDTSLEKVNKLSGKCGIPELSSYQYQSLKNNLKVYFKDGYLPDPEFNILQIRDRTYNHPLTWQPLRLSISSKYFLNNINSEFDIQTNLQTSSGFINNNIITYTQIFPGCDDSYKILPNELRHDLILQTAPNGLIESTFESLPFKENQNYEAYTLNFLGLLTLPDDFVPVVSGIAQKKPFETSESIELVTLENNEYIYQIKPPMVYEQQKPANQDLCSYEFIPVGGIESSNCWSKTIIIVKTDLSWLTDPERNYPVVIDPDITTPNWEKGEEGYDSYIVKGNETNPELSGHNFGKDRELKISLAGPSLYSKEHLYFRCILKFPGIKSLSTNAQVIDARLILQCKESSGTISITVFRLFDDWIEGDGTVDSPTNEGASWNSSGYNIWSGGNYNGSDTTTDTVMVSTGGYYQWDVTGILETWVNNPSTNYGFLLTGTDNEDIITIFHSSEALKVDVRPKLTVRYNTPPTFIGPESIVLKEPKEGKIKDAFIYNMSGNPNNNIDGIFYDPDVWKGEDILDFQIWDGTLKKNKDLNWLDTGIYSSKNITVNLRPDDRLEITPANLEIYGEDNILLRTRDKSPKSLWLQVEITIKITTINDPPKIVSIGNSLVEEMDNINIVELEATESVAANYLIVVDDPDNPEFLEKNVKNNSHNAPADLEFRWETEKTKKFTIEQSDSYSAITFNPDNSLVGEFYINITVYDTYYNKPYVYSKLRKIEVSNYTVMIKFTIENVNNPPTKLRIIEPFETEYSLDELINFKAKCRDPDLFIPNSNERLTYIWSSNIDGELGIGQEVQTRLSKGKHQITVEVSDIENEFKKVSINVSIRNRVTISPANCTNTFSDDDDDVLLYYYSRTIEDEQDFWIERGSDFPDYDIYIDIVELTSIRFRNYLIINLTFNDGLSLNLDLDNYRYKFDIYLIKPGHKEIIKNINKMKYDSRLFDNLYSPEQDSYYGRFELDDGELVNNGYTLKIKKHLGDLEFGEGMDSKLKPDFSLFATAKVELKQHPRDTFEHIVCYDSIGLGSEPAPNPQQMSGNGDKTGEDEGANLGFFLLAITIGIIIVIVIVLFIRKKRLEEEKLEEKTTIDGTRPAPGMPLPLHMPPHPIVVPSPRPSPFIMPPPMLPPHKPSMPPPGLRMPPPMFPMFPSGSPPGQYIGAPKFQPGMGQPYKGGKLKKKSGFLKKTK